MAREQFTFCHRLCRAAVGMRGIGFEGDLHRKIADSERVRPEGGA